MDYKIIDTMPTENEEMCTLRDYISGMSIENYRICWGESAIDVYPKDASVTMSPKEKGIVLSGLVANTNGNLIVHTKIKDLILQHDSDPSRIECLPLRIFNHKKRLASDEYWVINPLGLEDCLDLKRSTISRDEEGKLIEVDEIVLLRQKIDPGRAIFHVKQAPGEFIARADWLAKIKELGFKPSNVFTTLITITEPRKKRS